MSFVEGIKAIPADIAAVPTREGKLRRAAEIGKILVDEVTGVLKAIPYGIRALRQHKKLPDALARSNDETHVNEVSIARNVRYADSPRAVMDVYLPRGVSLADEFALDAEGRVVDATLAAPSSSSSAAANGEDDPLGTRATNAGQTPTHPVALFIHGGVWAVGEKWQFAPMAHRLAEEGVVTCVATYSLFPQALAPRMWEEVSDALTFTMDNASKLCPGASADRVVLVGHSAGAHLCAMALMHRRGAVPEAVEEKDHENDVAKEEATKTLTRAKVDARQPRAFVGLCGVYDVATHYAYEDSRGVALVSTMARAMGGKEGFDRASPLRLVRAAPEAFAAVSVDPSSTSFARRNDPSDDGNVSVSKSAAKDADDVVTETQNETGSLSETSKGDFMRRTDWAPMGIMDTDENISVGDIVAEARSALAAATAAKTRHREASVAADAVYTNGVVGNDVDDASLETTDRTETARLAAFAKRRRAPPPGPPTGAFAGDEAARQAGYVHSATCASASSASLLEPEPALAPGCFPPAYLLAGCADITVPWFESAEFHLALTDAGARSRVLLYLKEQHGSFVLKWHPRGEAPKTNAVFKAGDGEARDATSAFAWNDGLGDGDGLTPYCRDIVRVIKHA
jgi:acetyl esterase/lipase